MSEQYSYHSLSRVLNECFMCNQCVENPTRIVQGFSPLTSTRRHELPPSHSLTCEVNEVSKHLLMLHQLLQNLLACPGQTLIAAIHHVECIYSFVPPGKQRELPPYLGTLAVETGK